MSQAVLEQPKVQKPQAPQNRRKARIGMDVYYWLCDAVGNAVPVPAKLIARGIGDGVWHLNTQECGGVIGAQQAVRYVPGNLQRPPKPARIQVAGVQDPVQPPWPADPKVGCWSFCDEVPEELVS